MRKILVLLATLALIFGSAVQANADGSGTCTISGGTVHINVKELPGNGDVKYISIASPVRLNVLGEGSDITRSQLYVSPDYSQPVFPSYAGAYSSPVDGDGFFNYRIDYNYVHGGASSLIQHARVQIEQWSNTSECFTNIYIYP